MNKFTKQLLEGGRLTSDQITPEEATQTFRELKMLMILNINKKELMNSGVIMFMLHPKEFGFVDAMKFGLPRADFLKELSYVEVRDKINELLLRLNEDIDNINFYTISAYNDLAYRNNEIVQQLSDLSGGEFHAYHEGQLVESRKTI